MIFYFSATGNCKHAAECIADGDRLISITDSMKNHETVFSLAENEPLGFVCPTYFWGLPSLVKEFLEALQIEKKGEHYTYYVATYGTTTGQSAGMAERILKSKGIVFNAKYSVQMPDTWTVIFDLSDTEKVAAKNAAAEKEIAKITEQIKNRVTGNHIRHEVPYFLAACIYPAYSSARKTSHLSVNDSCIGCGLCERKCPAQAIEMKNGRPTWTKSQCVMCLGCLHRCPRFAIQYGKKTRKHGQYKNPYTQI